MDFDSERDFWDDVPTYSSKRVRVGSRSHFSGAAPRRRPILRTLPGERDRLMMRLGLLVGVLVLLIPVILAMRPDSAADVLGSQGAGAMAVPNPAPAISMVTVSTMAGPAPVDAAQAPVSAAVAVEIEAAVASPQGGQASGSATAKVATPVVAAPVECAQSYTVLQGDYWIKIATRVSVKLGELLAANNATVATPLYPKRTICLPAHAVVPVAAPTTTAATTTSGTSPSATTPPATTPKAPPTTAKPVTPTTTAAPTTTAPATTTTTTTVPPRIYSRAEVEAIIREIWPDELEDEAIRIATRESNLKPAVRNYCCFGLFQIYFSVHKSWLAGMGVASSSQLFDARVNAQAALTLFMRAGGWGPWQ